VSSLDERLSKVTTRTADFLASRQIPAEIRLLDLECAPDGHRGDLVVEPRTPSEASSPPVPANDGGRALAKRVEGLTSVSRQFSLAAWSGRLDASSRAELRNGARRFLPGRVRREHGALGPRGGLVYRLETQTANGWQATCWDAGGFLDDNPNTEMTPWPPQAMGMYYADAYAAAAFARRATDEGEPWRTRALAALDHARRTYHRYVAAPIWYHHEFKNAPMMEAWRDLGRPGGASWMDRLHSDNYDPNNVMAVRLHWVALRQQLRPQRGDQGRIARARVRLLGCQEPSGLFRDDRPPSHRGVRDLSYHLFTLGFLARYLAVREDEAIADAFDRGVALAQELQLDDGTIALTGRGTNNVYQQAAAVLAFAHASAVGRPCLDGASAALGPIESWQRADGFLPTALNSDAAGRMAWNHCATPYNALSCYLLACASDQLAKLDTAPALGRRPVSLDNAFARLVGDATHVFATGYLGSTWSGRHGSGVAGTAGVVHSQRQLFLALDHLSDTETQVTDLPQVVTNGVTLDWRRPGRLERLSPETIAYHVDASGEELTVLLTVRGDVVRVELHLPRKVDTLAWGRLPLLEGCSLRWTAGAAAGAHETTVPSNPRGPGRLVTWPLHLDGARASYAYRIGASLVTILDSGMPTAWSAAPHPGPRPSNNSP